MSETISVRTYACVHTYVHIIHMCTFMYIYVSIYIYRDVGTNFAHGPQKTTKLFPLDVGFGCKWSGHRNNLCPETPFWTLNLPGGPGLG